MNSLDEITLGDVRRTLTRYRPFAGVVIGILLIVAFLPGAETGRLATDVPDAPGGSVQSGDDASGTGFGDGSGTAGGETGDASGGFAGLGTVGNTRTTSPASGRAGGANVAMVANCDPATGKVKIPSKFAAPCVPAFSGNNGGATARGVTRDTIKIVWYEVREDPATASVLTAAGANDTPEQERQQVRDWIEFYTAHYEQYGRKVEVEFLPASGETNDDAAARADAIRAAEQMKAFAVMNAPTTNVFVDELVARGVMCFCTVSQPIETYLRWAPYVWSNLAASSQLYIHRAEYIRRLARKPAKWAGDPQMRTQQRKFGVLYYDTDAKAYKPGVDFFLKQLKDAGIEPVSVVEYHGYPQTARSQEEARPAIQRLVQSGATSVICICDPFGPIFMTAEATRQAYLPEWVITGSALTDTSFFARLYDQTQWEHAFGQSALPARMPETLQDPYRIYRWHFQKEPSGPNGYAIYLGPLSIFFNGVHMAGPKLTPATVRDGLWSIPPAGVGGITANAQSYGRHGFWPWDDYLSFDDMTEVWWDRSARGQDEIGGEGNGLYRYVDMGKRHLAGKWPQTEPRVFDPANTALIYDKPPAVDQWPEYPSPQR